MSDATPAPARILYLVGGPGNAERVDVSDLFARHVAAAGFDVDYVIFSRDPGPAWREVGWHGARAWVVGRSARPGLAGAVVSKWYEFLADLRTFAKALSGDYDVVQVRDKFVVGVLAGLAARLRGRVFTYWLSYPFAECRIVDGREGNSAFPRLSIAGGTAAKWLLYRIILPLADHVFVQSEQMKADVTAEGIDPCKMTAVPMAVGEALLEQPRRAPVPGTILYLGTLIRVRRLDTLLEALRIVHRQHPGARLVFVGEGDSPEDRAFLERRAAELGLGAYVEFTGMLPMAAAHERVASAAVCVSPFYPIPILLSTSPTKISEYMALGRPVVANAHPEQSRIIAESGAGLCVDWSAEAFAAAIVQLLDDPAAAERMGALGREYVRSHRIYPVVAPRVVAEYRRLLGGPAGRARASGHVVTDTRARARDSTRERPGAPGIIFVTGASRSGTTMLARMLGRARDAYTLHELHYYGELVPFEHAATVLPRERAERAVAMTLARHARDYWVSGPTPEERSLAREIVQSAGAAGATGDSLFAATLDRIRDMTGAAVLCEQTPRNVYYAFHLLEAFPDCRIVHVVRDPRAVLASQKRRYQLRKLGGHNVPVREVVRLWLNYHPITMVRLWRSATREILQLAAHPRVSIVRYEDLVLDAEATVRALCGEIGLPFEREMLDVPHWGSSTVQHTSAAGPSAAALDKWREILDGQEVAYCDAATVAERRRFAYPDAAPAVRLKDRALFAARLPLHVAGTVLANPKRAVVQLKALFARAPKSRDEKAVDDAAVH